jgi:hypothetical protein
VQILWSLVLTRGGWKSRIIGYDGQRRVIVVRRHEESEILDEATLIALTGASHRNLTRWRQQGLIRPIELRHGRGAGHGTTPLKYSMAEVSKIKRLNELRREFKKVAEWRWRLWLEDYPGVRIAPDLADTLDQVRARVPKIRTVGDIEAMIPASFWKPIDLPRGNPLRAIFHGLNRNDLRSLTTMLICIVFGIRLPLFDEPNPLPFRIFKRTFGLPEEWEMPRGLFDVFPFMHEQIVNGLKKPAADNLEDAKAACQFLSRLLDDAKSRGRGAIVASDTSPPRRLIEFASLMWPSPVARATTVGILILLMRSLKSVFGKESPTVIASIAREVSTMLAGGRVVTPLHDQLFGRVKDKGDGLRLAHARR